MWWLVGFVVFVSVICCCCGSLILRLCWLCTLCGFGGLWYRLVGLLLCLAAGVSLLLIYLWFNSVGIAILLFWVGWADWAVVFVL